MMRENVHTQQHDPKTNLKNEKKMYESSNRIDENKK